MVAPRIKFRRTVSLRIGLSIIVLTLASIVMLVAIIGLIAGLGERGVAEATSVREDAVWAAYQTDREAARLTEAVIRAQIDGSVEEVLLRFDLLYSRIGLLGSGSYAIAFDPSSSVVGDTARSVSEQVLALTPLMDALVDNPDLFATRGGEIISATTKLREDTGSMIVAANAAVGTIRVAERAATLHAHWQIVGAVAALTTGLVLIVALLGHQLLLISRNGREIELLSQQNARAAEAARAASQAKSAFLATMSHEIRTPLNGIIGMTEVLTDANLRPEQAEQVRVIRQSGDMLLELIGDVLDFSKLEAGAVQAERDHFVLGDLMAFLRDMMQPRAKAAGIQFSLSHPHVSLDSDAAKLRQVLVNLVGNAIKFTSHGAVSVTVTISDDSLRCRVDDTGPGIAAEDLPRLFKQFSQIDSSHSRSHGGSGLGLAICRGLIEAMGGQIGVDSNPGHGSSFWFTVPVSGVTACAPPTAWSEPEPPKPVVLLSGPLLGGTGAASGRVLIVDDNAINRQVAGALIARMGLEPVYAQDGAEAIQTIALGGLDLVLMDMQMPVLDGVAATQQVRELGFNVPIVGLTANAMNEDRQTCARVGMDDFIVKPVTRAKLEATLTPLLQQIEAPQLDLSPSTVDLNYQQTLVDELGLDSFNALRQQFRVDAVRLVDAAILGHTLSDAMAVRRALHTLKGAALSLGYTAIATRAEDLRVGPFDIEQLETLRRDAA